jgi:hypothetical protein
MTLRVKTGALEPIRVPAWTKAGKPLTGATDLYIRIERVSDGYFLDWSDMTFKTAGWTTLNKMLTEVDATNLAGIYEVSGGFDLSTITNKTANDDYTVYPLQTPGSNAQLPASDVIQEGDWVDEAASGTPTAVASAVWDESASAHGTAGTFGKQVNDTRTRMG